MDDTFDATEQAAWDAMKAEQPIPAPEPVADPTPAPEPVAEPVAEPEEKEVVPLKTLIEERKRLQEREDRLMKRLQDLESKLQPPAPKPAPPKIDPQNLTVEALQHIAERVVEMEQTAEQQAELAQIAEFGSRHAAEFKKATPDFEEAYNHLRQSRAQQLIESGQVKSAQDLSNTLRQEEANLLRLCAQWGVNPASFVYNLAQGAGYAKAAPEAPAVVPASTPARDPATGQFQAVKPDPKEKIQMAAKAQERATNPVATAGAGTGGPLDLSALANMDGDDFDKATSGKGWAKLWGAA